MRLSQENENRQGSSNRQPPPSHRKKETVGVSCSFPKSKRLRSRDDFRRIRKYGKRLTGNGAIFEILSEKKSCQRLGITVSKRFGDAHLRNLFKRRTREAFRLSQADIPPGVSINVFPRQEGIVPTLQQFLDDFRECFKHVKP